MKKISDFPQGTDKIFVLGSGYSLDDYENLEMLLKPYTVIACNGAISIFTDKIEYWLITDEMAYEAGYSPKKTLAKNIILANNEMERHEKDNVFCLPRRYENRTWDFSLCNFDGKLICGTDCVHVAANFAYCLGAETIYLLGVDLRWQGNKKHNNDTNKMNVEKSVKIPGEDTDIDLKNSFAGWQNIIKQNVDVKFINCSKTGRLAEIMPTMDLRKCI